MIDGFVGLFVIVLLLGFFALILSIPIMIARAKNITGGEMTIIVVLSWLGIFFGVTWLVALILSLVWPGNRDNLDQLGKLARLYKEKVITKDEYEKMKAKLLK